MAAYLNVQGELFSLPLVCGVNRPDPRLTEYLMKKLDTVLGRVPSSATKQQVTEKLQNRQGRQEENRMLLIGGRDRISNEEKLEILHQDAHAVVVWHSELLGLPGRTPWEVDCPYLASFKQHLQSDASLPVSGS